MTWKNNRWTSRKVKKTRSTDYDHSTYYDYEDDPYIYRYHDPEFLYWIRTRTPMEGNLYRRRHGESMEGWPEAEDECWCGGSQEPRLYFTPARWNDDPASAGKAELRVKKSDIERDLTIDKDLPPDAYIEGEGYTLDPKYVEVNINGKWIPLNKAIRNRKV